MKLDVNQTTLEVEERGSGQPVTFCHAEFSDLRAWAAQLEAFSPKFRAITYSRRHYRPNPEPPADWDNSVHTHVEDLAAMIKALKIERADVVGLSSGGLLTMRFASKYPQLVRRLVVCEPDVTSLFIPYQPKPTDMMKLLFMHPLGGTSAMHTAMKGLWPSGKLFDQGQFAEGVKVFMNGSIGPKYFGLFSPERVEQMVANAPSSACYFKHGAHKSGFDSWAEVQAISLPSLCVWGQNSPHMQRMYAKAVHAHIPGARSAIIPSAAHFVNEHNTAAFNQAVFEYLSAP